MCLCTYVHLVNHLVSHFLIYSRYKTSYASLSLIHITDSSLHIKAPNGRYRYVTVFNDKMHSPDHITGNQTLETWVAERNPGSKEQVPSGNILF